MAKKFRTPGVYVREENAFPNSVVQVDTAIPIFVGYTAHAKRGNTDLTLKAIKIQSLREFHEYFGGAPEPSFEISASENAFELKMNLDEVFYLYASLRLFFQNGGGFCYILSVGCYEDKPSLQTFIDGIDELRKLQEASLLVIPDANLLSFSECSILYKKMMMHCGTDMESRFAILDFPYSSLGEDDVESFRNDLGTENLDYAAVYYPWLNTLVFGEEEISLLSISNKKTLIELLKVEMSKKLGVEIDEKAVEEKVPGPLNVNQNRFKLIEEELAKLTGEEAKKALPAILAFSQMAKEIVAEMRRMMNVLPPSGAISGIYAQIDSAIGVHKAPANISLQNVISPVALVTHEEQEDLNLPVNGKAINVLRAFPGRGVLVWGARTLDGNSPDWCYINVRRTMIMIKQSIRTAMESFVFEPNNKSTWIRVRATISNFLNNVWKQGSLAGASPNEAFQVEIGTDSTMSLEDVSNGIMRVNVKVAIVRPAEFLVITFQQRMQEN